LQQTKQQVENLRPDGNRLAAPGKLAPVGIEHVVAEHELHFGATWLRSHALSTLPRDTTERAEDSTQRDLLDEYPRQAQ
jgi:hypothetical protein